jgi:hypothetical protein
MKNFTITKFNADSDSTKAGVLAFAFGVPYNIWPNQTIATIAARKALELGAPVFTQQDIQFNPSWGIEADYCSETPGNPPPTLRIAREAMLWANSLGLKEVWVVGARPHLHRIIRDINYLIKYTNTSIKFRLCEETLLYWPEEYYAKNSIQPRVTSARAWWPRELILLAMPMFVYRRIAG